MQPYENAEMPLPSLATCPPSSVPLLSQFWKYSDAPSSSTPCPRWQPLRVTSVLCSTLVRRLSSQSALHITALKIIRGQRADKSLNPQSSITKLNINADTSAAYKELFNTVIPHRNQLHVENIPAHCTKGSTYEGVRLHFNERQGNGLFNLASELGWILWLRIWQWHFHTLRKWWFYTCCLSPCVKRLFHHCQRQMQRSPFCHSELLRRGLVITE